MNARSKLPTPVNLKDAAESAAWAYHGLLMNERATAWNRAPDHGSGHRGANPWKAGNPLADAYDMGWHWARQAAIAGQTAFDSVVAETTISPYEGVWKDIFEAAKRQTMDKLGVAEAA